MTCCFVDALKVGAVALLLIAAPASAQPVNWQLVDAGVFTHSTYGQGIEMRIKPVPMEDGLFDDPNIVRIMAIVCNHYAPSVVPYVKNKLGLDAADFIAVHLISGGKVFGQYIVEFFTLENDRCGAALDV